VKKVLFISGLYSTDRILLNIYNKKLLDKKYTQIWSQCKEDFISNIEIPIKFFSLDIKYSKYSIVSKVRKWHNKQFDFWHYSYFRRVNLSPKRPIFKIGSVLADNIAVFFYKYFTYTKYFKNIFDTFNPDNVVLMWPYDMSNVNVAGYSKIRKKKTIAFVTGFDNISTKSRFPIFYDRVLVWSSSMKQEFLNWYPTYKTEQVKVVGAPQYDIFFNENFKGTKTEFLTKHIIDAEKKIILYAVGSPNLLNEVETFIGLYKLNIFRGKHVILRLHPGFRYEHEQIAYLQSLNNVSVQVYNLVKDKKSFQDYNVLKEWVSTFYYCDILINTSSTVILDAAIFNKPIINLDFEISSTGEICNKKLLEINENWFHIKKILKHACVVRVDGVEDLILALTKIGKYNNCDSLISDFFDDTLGKSAELFTKECFD
jgi:CDP-glycerol glycerophosphotransferase (TagB/SpsB family)